MNHISYSESHFLLCAHTAPTILVSLVPVPWIYIHFFLSVTPTFTSQSWLYLFVPDSIIGIFFLQQYQMSSNLKYPKQNFDLPSFQFSSPPRFLHLGKWYHLLPNVSQHNTWSHLRYSVSHSYWFNPLENSVTCVPPCICTTRTTWIYHAISLGKWQKLLHRFLLLPLSHIAM